MLSRTLLSLRRRAPQSALLLRAMSSTSSSSSSNRRPPSTALVLGSCGALGSTVASYLSQNVGMRVIGADVVDEAKASAAARHHVHAYCRLPVTTSVPALCTALYTSVQDVLQDFAAGDNNNNNDNDDDPVSLDVIVCANGGWQGDPVAVADNDPTAQLQASAAVLEHMLQVNLHPVLATALCIQNDNHNLLLSNHALVVIMGATAALQPTPGMLAYGTSKAAVHHVVQTLGANNNKKQHVTPTVVGILPTTLDTPANRVAMPEANFHTWTQPAHIAQQIGTWIDTPSLRPASGSLVKVSTSTTSDGQASFQLVR